ncbi:hypothetical protein A0H76_2523 [Hepatospora eriocheir]|uniref:Uncharacterized protein n=1 Tax=Hepatospora eriocheir TaxID=1081669 RepID=A0A1X0QFA7_9MICR|nr:hypothetical protein A0H76_2523 [Hepatospora eriocheir]
MITIYSVQITVFRLIIKMINFTVNCNLLIVIFIYINHKIYWLIETKYSMLCFITIILSGKL